MYIVTGAAGFIGSHIVKELNERGINDIIAVDRLDKSDKFKNLCDRTILDYFDAQELSEAIQKNSFNRKVKAIFHQGACSDTTEANGEFMMKNNFSFSKLLLEYALTKKAAFIYASSAAVYGSSKNFRETQENELPLNVYGYSKLAFDQYVKSRVKDPDSSVVGLRYFNVYGEREIYKGKMASMIYQMYKQIKETSEIRLFEGSENYAPGEQSRDFVYVKDIVDVNLFFGLNDRKTHNILNCGTGESRTFNEAAKIVISLLNKGKITYIKMPDDIRKKYQSYTKADLNKLRASGYEASFSSLEDGVKNCVKYWEKLN